MKFPYKIYCRLFIALLTSCYLPVAMADETKGGYNRPVLENQQKYAVPAETAEGLWLYISKAYTPAALKKINPYFTGQKSTETHVDEYFDDSRFTLLRHQHSLRLRRVFAGKAIDRQFIQVKVSKRPRLRNIRQEVKFNVNDQPDKRGLDNGHPLLRLIRAADRRQVDSLLATLGVKSQNLRPVMEVRQQRRRLYLREKGNELAYISLDYVTADDGETGFYELELALDEQTYTAATAARRKSLNHILELLHLDLTSRFITLKQDQTPKYNKMYNLQHQGRMRPQYYNLAWVAVGLVLGGVSLFLFRTRNQPAPTSKEMF